MLDLEGKAIVICADTNAHSPLWYSERRQYTGRGRDADYRRREVQGFIASHGLAIANEENQPPTFSNALGQSNTDVTLSRGVGVHEWRVWPGVSSSDYQLITLVVYARQYPGAFGAGYLQDTRSRLVPLSLPCTC